MLVKDSNAMPETTQWWIYGWNPIHQDGKFEDAGSYCLTNTNQRWMDSNDITWQNKGAKRVAKILC